jgi:hypothetical protein
LTGSNQHDAEENLSEQRARSFQANNHRNSGFAMTIVAAGMMEQRVERNFFMLFLGTYLNMTKKKHLENNSAIS